MINHIDRKIELLAPGGDIDSIKAAIIAGANAIYCGLDRFNARNRAENIRFKDLTGVLRLAHSHGCQVFLTLNIIVVESEIPALVRLLNKLVNTTIDGIIVQDLGMFFLLSKYFPSLAIHASTQLTTHNEGQIRFLAELNTVRVNLSRELNLNEIGALTAAAHEHNIAVEIFVHGSYCISFSGICYLSSVLGGNSGNRGRCSQPCRDQYVTTAQGNDFPLNLKDNSAYSNLKELRDAGVDSIKIEGRIKKFHYVYTVVNSWRRQLQTLYDQDTLTNDNHGLYKVFNRDFSNAYLTGDITKDMFIDNPRDNSALHLAERTGGCSAENVERAKKELYDLKTDIITTVKSKIEQLTIAKVPLIITVSGKAGRPLNVSVQTPETSFDILSDSTLIPATPCSADKILASRNEIDGVEGLDYKALLKRLKALNDTEYFIWKLDLENLHSGLFIPFQELTLIKKRILFHLNGLRESVVPIELPFLKKRRNRRIKPSLSLLISSQKDLHLCSETRADIYFQLPNSLNYVCSEFIDLFMNNTLIPWFPSILLGEDFATAVEFLHKVRPKRIVTNNTGIAYEAWQKKIPWIAGPYLNIVNSYSLLCLKENFDCYGAFISNEISKNQIKSMKKPDDFELYYSIYHPILLLTSRQCLFQQVTGCEKDRIDDSCMQQCEKSASITNLKNNPLLIKKNPAYCHSIYNETNFLNTDIITDLPDFFSGFFVDLRDIETATTIEMTKSRMVVLFEDHLNGKPASTEELKQKIHPSTNTQYHKGI